MRQSILVLGTLHEIQGPRFRDFVDDPSYRKLLETAMSGVDFVFEEASGRRPSIAEQDAELALGFGRYADIDPSANERPLVGIPASTGSGFPIDPCSSPDACATEDHVAHRLREEEWIRRIQSQQFQKALVIVGIAHSLSFQRRLSDVGFDAQVWAYTPHAKLCRRKHSG